MGRPTEYSRVSMDLLSLLFRETKRLKEWLGNTYISEKMKKKIPRDVGELCRTSDLSVIKLTVPT